MRCLASRLQTAVAPLLHSSQAGFLRGRSTLEHLLTMRLCLEQTNSPLHVLLLDIAKAYDTVPWLRLQQALRRIGCPPAFCRLVDAMMCGSRSCVRTAFGLTADFEQRRGVLQGSPLSCLLFLIFLIRSYVRPTQHWAMRRSMWAQCVLV